MDLCSFNVCVQHVCFKQGPALFLFKRLSRGSAYGYTCTPTDT